MNRFTRDEALALLQAAEFMRLETYDGGEVWRDMCDRAATENGDMPEAKEYLKSRWIAAMRNPGAS